MHRSTTNRVASTFALLTLLGLVSCQELSPTAGREEPAAMTTQALPASAVGEWTAYPTAERKMHSGVALGDGSVLVCGGLTSPANQPVENCSRLSFDGMTLRSQSFPLPKGRISATLTLVSPDRVLLAGGLNSSYEPEQTLLSVPLGSWTDGGNIWEPAADIRRVDHTDSLLDRSLVLIGGIKDNKYLAYIDVRSEEGQWSQVVPDGDLHVRTYHTATVLKTPPGSPARVLILGGHVAGGKRLKSGFVFSLPQTIKPIADMPEERDAHTATLLDDGSVLVVGGTTDTGPAPAVRYIPESNSWVSAGPTSPRVRHAAVRLGADVIVVGGQVNDGTSPFLGRDEAPADANIAQRYSLANNEWSPFPLLHQGRSLFQLLALDQTHIIAVGGTNGSKTLPNSEVFTAGALGDSPPDKSGCVSGYFADGVCCDAECDKQCQRCNDPAKLGVCQQVSGAPPAGKSCGNLQCPAQGQGDCPSNCDANNPCLVGYYCTSTGQCDELKGFGVQCKTGGECAGDAPCVDGSCSERCDASTPCRADFFCAGAVCHAKKAIGRACGAASECSDSHCVDGVCCESSCLGSCVTCNAPDQPGLCLPLEKGAVCGEPQCTSDGFQPPSTCDGAGTCMGEPTTVCAPYVCDNKHCLSECGDEHPCVGEGYHCHGGKCLQCDENACNETGYRCDTTVGECRTSCQTSKGDCAGGYYCHPLEHRCVEAIPFPAGALPACGMTRKPVHSRLPLVALASVLCAVAARRKLRTSRRVS
ncbi:MAG TPA: hypothetical protein VFK05_27880 [Polyangiaceae bacterium]|nr:hypothetical protein [Polyangiaceae bacterium]